MKKIRLMVTESQFDLITTALVEYSDVCSSDCEDVGYKDGFMEVKSDRKSGLFKLSKQLRNCCDSLYRQKQKGDIKNEEENSETGD